MTNNSNWKNETVKIEDILNTIQVRPETTTKEMDGLVRSLKKEGGLLQPIGLCNSKELEEYPEKKYHLIWGQRRIYAAKQLGWTEIEARVWNMDDVLESGEIRSKAIAENEFRYDMSKSEVRKAVMAVYLDFDKNETKTKAALPLDNKIIDDALKDIKIENIKGAKEVVQYLKEDTNISSPDAYKWSVVDVCKLDESEIDSEKAKKLIDVLAKHDAPLIKKILKKANDLRDEEVETWEQEAIYGDDLTEKRVPFLESEVKLLESYIAENNLGDLKDYIHDITMASFDKEDVESDIDE
jgi:ParB/RepB/Spo0J family partition protein